MKKFAVLALFCFFSLALPAQNGGRETRRLNDVQYKAPQGWKPMPQAANMQVFVSPNSTPAKQAMIIISESEPFTGSFRDVFVNAVQKTLGGMKPVKASEVTSSKTEEGHDVLMQAMTAQAANGMKLYSVFVGVDVNGRMVVVNLSANAEDLFQGYQKDLNQFMADVQLPKGNTAARNAGSPPASSPVSQVNMPSPSTIARDEDARRKPGIVSGNIYDAQGRPFRIPGAKVVVHIWGAGSNGDRVGFNIPMDGNGHYEMQVPGGLYGFDARAYMPLNGNTVCIRLEPLDGRPTEQAVHSAPGIVKDFQLRLTGPQAGGNLSTVQGYHGGALTITDGNDWKNPYFGALTKSYPQGSKVVLTLVPLTPLIDGSRGQSLTLECPIEQMTGGGVHKANIPLAAYRVTAKLVTPDGNQKQMRVAALPNVNFSSAVDVLYGPDGGPDGFVGIPNVLVGD